MVPMLPEPTAICVTWVLSLRQEWYTEQVKMLIWGLCDHHSNYPQQASRKFGLAQLSSQFWFRVLFLSHFCTAQFGEFFW